MRCIRSVVLWWAVASLSGCFLAPAIQSFKELGATKADRMVLLTQEIKKFHEALYWGRSEDALRCVSSSQRDALKARLRRATREERVVDSKIEELEFTEDGYSATAEVVVRSYAVPYYRVNDRSEKQSWEFSLTDGWKLTAIEDIRPTG